MTPKLLAKLSGPVQVIGIFGTVLVLLGVVLGVSQKSQYAWVLAGVGVILVIGVWLFASVSEWVMQRLSYWLRITADLAEQGPLRSVAIAGGLSFLATILSLAVLIVILVSQFSAKFTTVAFLPCAFGFTAGVIAAVTTWPWCRRRNWIEKLLLTTVEQMEKEEEFAGRIVTAGAVSAFAMMTAATLLLLVIVPRSYPFPLMLFLAAMLPFAAGIVTAAVVWGHSLEFTGHANSPPPWCATSGGYLTNCLQWEWCSGTRRPDSRLELLVDTRTQPDWNTYLGEGRFNCSDREVGAAYEEAGKQLMQRVSWYFPVLDVEKVTIEFFIMGVPVGTWQAGKMTLAGEE